MRLGLPFVSSRRYPGRSAADLSGTRRQAPGPHVVREEAAAIEDSDQLAIEHPESRRGGGRQAAQERWQLVQGVRLQVSRADDRLDRKRHLASARSDRDEAGGRSASPVWREESAEIDDRNGQPADNGYAEHVGWSARERLDGERAHGLDDVLEGQRAPSAMRDDDEDALRAWHDDVCEHSRYLSEGRRPRRPVRGS
jgi:hypothetical protein